MADMQEVYTPRRTLRSQNSLSLTMPRTRTQTYGERSFSKAAPSLWNALPYHIRASSTLNAFKRDLKTHIFTAHYEHI